MGNNNIIHKRNREQILEKTPNNIIILLQNVNTLPVGDPYMQYHLFKRIKKYKVNLYLLTEINFPKNFTQAWNELQLQARTQRPTNSMHITSPVTSTLRSRMGGVCALSHGKYTGRVCKKLLTPLSNGIPYTYKANMEDK